MIFLLFIDHRLFQVLDQDGDVPLVVLIKTFTWKGYLR